MLSEEETIRKITDFWCSCSFLKKFKELGEKYEQQIKKEKGLSKEEDNGK